jgi:hypothetical protein
MSVVEEYLKCGDYRPDEAMKGCGCAQKVPLRAGKAVELSDS